MEGNPYVELLSRLREDTREQIPTYYRFGRVISVNPFRVEAGGIILGSADLLKNKDIYNLETGDSVLLLPIDDQQRFIMLCKVVSL